MVTFLRKLNKEDPSYCSLCRNTKESKRLAHAEWMTGKNVRNMAPKDAIPVQTASQLHEDALIAFQSLSMKDREQYFKRHITHEELCKLMPHIQGLRNGNVNRMVIERCEYWEVFPSHNQMKFTSVFYDPVTTEVYRIDQPVFKCEVCDTCWKAKNIVKMKNAKKVLCRNCSLCRKVFKVRSTENALGQKVTYQSRPEKQFLDWCDEQNILVQNGPDVPYEFAGKQRIYRVDFYLPSIGYLIEIKDDHCWHREQVRSGKWDAKMKGIESHISKVGSKFLMITPQNKTNAYAEILNRINKI